MTLGLVELPASHEGITAAERVTITSVGGADGQPGVTTMVVVVLGTVVIDCLQLISIYKYTWRVRWYRYWRKEGE